MLGFLKDLKRKDHKTVFGALDIIKYIGPGLLVTVGFIDPGNWASNLAAGSDYGYTLLWMITLSTIMLIVLQHNVAHLGIATGLCLSEAARVYLKPRYSTALLSTAVLASISTAFAELLGASIAINMLFHIPLGVSALISLITALILVFRNSYRRIETIIIGFVSIIGLAFIYELTLVDIDWKSAGLAFVSPSIPEGSMIIIMSVLGAVVMPHNLFLHSEIIQSRQWNTQDDKIIKKQLDYELFDTLFSMIVGFAINSAIILLAAATFYKNNVSVSELEQSQQMLKPLMGNAASLVFAIALLFAGIASSITASMAGGSIFAGFFKEPYNIKDNHSKLGVLITLIPAGLLILIISNPLKGLILSQMLLSIQLPFTIFLQIFLTSSKKVMGKYVNKWFTNVLLVIIGVIIVILNIALFGYLLQT
jgi:manganese transport protein